MEICNVCRQVTTEEPKRRIYQKKGGGQPILGMYQHDVCSEKYLKEKLGLEKVQVPLK